VSADEDLIGDIPHRPDRTLDCLSELRERLVDETFERRFVLRRIAGCPVAGAH